VIAAGIDIGTTGSDRLIPWGANGAEAKWLHRAGLSAEETVAAITSDSPLTLGPQAPRSGALEVGFDADVIGLTTNPLLDLAILGRPDAVTHVWNSGNLIKSPGNR
jgi:imidazolonepropionase-like amidohydrolase